MRFASAIAVLETRPRVVLGGLVVAQWIAVAVFALSVEHDGWLYYHGGDDTFYYTTAWGLSEGEIVRSTIGYGWSLLLAPIALFAGPNLVAALPAIVLFQVIVLLPLALVLVYAVAARVGGRLVGYATATVWVFLPYAAIPLFVDRYHDRYVELFLPQALGLTALADFPSMVALLAAAYFVLRALDGDDVQAAVAGGVIAGFALAIKPSNALFLPAALVALLVARRAKPLAAFAVSLLPAALTLALWKQRGLGELPVLAVEEVRVAAGAVAAAPLADLDLGPYVPLDWDRLGLHLLEVREFFWSDRLLEWTPLAGVVAVARVSAAKAVLLGLWLAGFVLIKGSSEEASVATGSILRLLTPAFPAFLVLAVSIVLLVPTFGPRVARRWRVGGGPLRLSRRALLAAAAASSVVPAALIAALPVQAEARTAWHPESSVFVPVHDLGLTARVDGRTVSLTWDRQKGSTRDFYRVYSSRKDDPNVARVTSPDLEGIRCLDVDGAPDCALQMVPLGETRTTAWRAEAAPGPPVSYRVAYLSGWRATADAADILMLSEPATVTIRTG